MAFLVNMRSFLKACVAFAVAFLQQSFVPVHYTVQEDF